MSGTSIIIIGGGGTHPRTGYTFPMAVDAFDTVVNQSADSAAVDYRAKGASITQEIGVPANSSYAFPSDGDVLSVT